MLGTRGEVSNLDRTLLRAVLVAAVLLVLAALVLGVAYYRQRYYRPAVSAVDRDIAAAEEQVRRQPDDVGQRIKVAYLYVQKGRHDDAIAQAQAVLAAAPDDFNALQVLGLAHAGKNDRAGAMAYFQRAVEANEDNPMAKASRQLANVRLYLGQAYLEDGRLDEAVAELRAVAASDSTNADALRFLGDALLRQGDAAAAAESYRRAVRLVPDYAEAYDGLVAAYEVAGNGTELAHAKAMQVFIQGDYAEAISRLRAIAPEWAGRPELHLGLAMAYERDGQRDEALAEYREVLRLAPSSIAAQYGLRRLTEGR